MSAANETQAERQGWISTFWMAHFSDVYLGQPVIFCFYLSNSVSEGIYFCYMIVQGNALRIKITLMQILLSLDMHSGN